MRASTPFVSFAEMYHFAKQSFADEAYESALSALNSSPMKWRNDVRAIEVAKRCYLQLGEVSRALGEANRLRRVDDGTGAQFQARFALGKLRETDTRWLPRVPAATSPSIPQDGVILHLLKESLPYSETGFTFRSRMTLEAQQLAGFEPVVVTSLGFPRYKGIDEVPTMEDVHGVSHYRLDYPSTPRSVTSLPFDIVLTEQARRTAAIVDEVRPQLIQAGTGFRGYETALIAQALAERSDLPFVYEVRGFQEATWTRNVTRAEQGEYYRRRWAQEQRCMHAAARVFTIGDAMRDEIVQRGVDEEKVFVIPNAVDIQRFAPRPKDPELVDRFGIDERPTIGYISNLGPREGLEHLVRATSTLQRRGLDVVCFIIGDGPEREGIESLRDELGLNEVIHLTGHVPNELIEDYYALIDVFVVPRIDDRAARMVTPLKPLEAMAMGIPVVASDLPALRELARPFERGMTFEPGNDEELADVISQTLNESGLRERLGENALRWVRSERSLTSNVNRYRKALSGID